MVVSSPRVTPGAVVEMRLGPGAASVRIPCRVVAVLDEPDRQGFAYGTLPGHPESGEELFLLERTAGGGATATVAAFSRPATALIRLGGPFARRIQTLMADRYLTAMTRPGG